MADDGGWDALRGAVVRAADLAIATMADPEVGARWTEPSALTAMTVGALAGHLGQMIEAPATWLELDPPDPATVTVAEGFEMYQSARLDLADWLDGRVASTIRTWADDRAGAGWTSVVAQAQDARDRLVSLLASAEPSRLIPSAVTPGLVSSLDTYLRTRCVEYVVHRDDLALSVGLGAPVHDPDALAIAIDVLVALCRERAGDGAVLRALARPDRADPDTLRAV